MSQSKNILQSKIFSHTNPAVLEFDINSFLRDHQSSKVTYSTSVSEGLCLFTAFVLYVKEVAA